MPFLTLTSSTFACPTLALGGQRIQSICAMLDSRLSSKNHQTGKSLYMAPGIVLVWMVLSLNLSSTQGEKTRSKAEEF